MKKIPADICLGNVLKRHVEYVIRIKEIITEPRTSSTMAGGCIDATLTQQCRRKHYTQTQSPPRPATVRIFVPLYWRVVNVSVIAFPCKRVSNRPISETLISRPPRPSASLSINNFRAFSHKRRFRALPESLRRGLTCFLFNFHVAINGNLAWRPVRRGGAKRWFFSISVFSFFENATTDAQQNLPCYTTNSTWPVKIRRVNCVHCFDSCQIQVSMMARQKIVFRFPLSQFDDRCSR